ncbi:MAG: hypothetical protein OXG04_18320 [Acidobacteria bacterium]|nr:hypothetical protein [Acidobacteriota bacterium]
MLLGIGVIVVTSAPGTCSNERADRRVTSVNLRIDDTNRRMEDRFNNLQQRMEDGFDNIDLRIDDTNLRIDNVQGRFRKKSASCARCSSSP